MYGYERDIGSIRNWMKKNKVSPSTLGQASVFRTSAVQRVLNGQCTLTTLRKVLRHIEKYPNVKQASRGK